MWYKNNDLIFQDAIAVGNVASNIIRQGDKSLTITNITEADAGSYRCEILKDQTGNPFIEHRILVHTAPTNISIMAKDNIREVR